MAENAPYGALQQANQQPEPALQPEQVSQSEPDYPYHMSDNELMNLYTEWDNYHTNAEPMVSELADNKPNQLGDKLTNNVDLQTAKHIYMNNAAKLNNSGKAQLQFYGRATLNALRGLNGENLDMAMKNYYVNTARLWMAGRPTEFTQIDSDSIAGNGTGATATATATD